MRRKLKIVLSDLHLGAGYAGEGGNELEDFVADEKNLYDYSFRIYQRQL